MSDMLNQNPVIDAAIKAAMNAVKVTAANPANPMSPDAVAMATPELKANIALAVTSDPVIQVATNTEAHWWQKRTMWSTLFTLGSAAGAAYVAFTQFMVSHTVDDGTKSVSILTVALGLWGAYTAFKAGVAKLPLFTKTLPYPLNKG